MEKPARVPKRRFPMVEHQYCKDKDSPSRLTRTILVEVMDPNDPELSWDAKNSDVYKVLRDLDLTHPDRTSFGPLSAGSNFVLFEVTGRNDPVFLVEEPTRSPLNRSCKSFIKSPDRECASAPTPKE